jgi:hypothetical protein
MAQEEEKYMPSLKKTKFAMDLAEQYGKEEQ